jgi:methylase of polypeptide subunit release factors
MPLDVPVAGETELLGVARALGAASVGDLTRAEARLLAGADGVAPELVRDARERLLAGEDPLGERLCTLRTPAERRARGAVYTPDTIVRAMTAWASARHPRRVVDPGAGSGRFLLAAARAFPAAELVAFDTDPVATLLLRAALAVHGLGARARVTLSDFRRAELPTLGAPTLFIGNPPYVRHHELTQPDKQWLVEAARACGLEASALAGLHAHFFVATALLARPGDFGAFVTAAEWLDVKYGALVRALFLERLGGVALHVIEPRARPFADAETTAVVACFAVGERPRTLRFRTVAESSELGRLDGGRALSRVRFERASRWTSLVRRSVPRPQGHVELGEIVAVHRGQVTGDNATWIDGDDSGLPERVRFAAVTRAKELFLAAPMLSDLGRLRRVIDLPLELDELTASERRRVEAFLRAARRRGVHQGFIAKHRRAWWSVGLRAPAPILASYMARRPPAFVCNPAGARHLNIAHGLYPRETLEGATLETLARWLNAHVAVTDGRTYAGGLTKFEPSEMERLIVPGIELLRAAVSERASERVSSAAESVPSNNRRANSAKTSRAPARSR